VLRVFNSTLVRSGEAGSELGNHERDRFAASGPGFGIDGNMAMLARSHLRGRRRGSEGGSAGAGLVGGTTGASGSPKAPFERKATGDGFANP
jgi:hypothetical protein